MRTSVVVVGCSFSYAMDLGGVFLFAAGSKDAEIREDIVLSMAANPGSTRWVNLWVDVKRIEVREDSMIGGVVDAGRNDVQGWCA